MCLRRIPRSRATIKYVLRNLMDGLQTDESECNKRRLQSTAEAVDVASAREQATTAEICNTQTFGAAAARLGVIGL